MSKNKIPPATIINRVVKGSAVIHETEQSAYPWKANNCETCEIPGYCERYLYIQSVEFDPKKNQTIIIWRMGNKVEYTEVQND